MDHINYSLYGQSEEDRKRKNEEIAALQRNFADLTYSALSSDSGREFLAWLEDELKAPIFVPGTENRDVMLVREGSRQLMIKILKAYEEGRLKDKTQQKHNTSKG